jgi:hypothetical protein
MAFVLSGIAQPKVVKNHEKFTRRINPENIIKKTKSNDWWEPDTIYQYGLDVPDSHCVFSYENGIYTNLQQVYIDNQWINTIKILYQYDSQHNLTEELEQDWVSGQWKNTGKYTYTYDAQNNITSYVQQLPESEEWNNLWQEIYIYDAQNKLIEIIAQYYDDTEQWKDNGRIVVTYDSQNNSTEMLYQYLRDGEWMGNEKEILTYDAQNNVIEKLGQYLGDEGWSTGDRVIYTYDSRNNRTSELWQYYWEEYDLWGNWELSTYSYDENNNAISGFHQLCPEDEWYDDDSYMFVYYNNMKSKAITNDCNRFTATYIKTNEVGIKENNLSNHSIKLYPNPVSNVLHIETNQPDVISEVKIYSVQGTLLMQTKGNNIDVALLPNGMYIVEVAGVFTKFVKQ